MRKLFFVTFFSLSVFSVFPQDFVRNDLPLTGVSLFSSGVGYFEHTGSVKDSVSIPLVFGYGRRKRCAQVARNSRSGGHSRCRSHMLRRKHSIGRSKVFRLTYQVRAVSRTCSRAFVGAEIRISTRERNDRAYNRSRETRRD